VNGRLPGRSDQTLPKQRSARLAACSFAAEGANLRLTSSWPSPPKLETFGVPPGGSVGRCWMMF